MKIKVRRKNTGTEWLVFDTLTNERKPVLAETSLQLKGIYEIIESVFLLLYKINEDELHLVINNHDILIDHSFAITYSQKPFTNMGILNVFHNQTKYVISYDLADMQPVSTIFYSEEEEDVNFGLWLSLVLNSNERRQIIISNW